MAFWAAVRFEPNRHRFASHCLRERGVEIWVPYIREKKIVAGRRRWVTMPLFVNYGFAVVVLQWSPIRYCPGVASLIMDGTMPAKVPDPVIDEFRGRERNGVVELPEPPPRYAVAAVCG